MRKTLALLVACIYLTACGSIQPAPTATSIPTQTLTPVPTSTPTPTLEPWMQSLPEDVVSVEMDGEQIIGLNSQGEKVMVYSFDSGEWIESVNTLEPVPVVEVTHPGWYFDRLQLPVRMPVLNIYPRVEKVSNACFGA